MKILFFIRSIKQVRLYKSLIGVLVRRGFKVLVVLDPRERRRVSIEPLEQLKKELPNLEYSFGFLRTGYWTRILFPVRELLSYRRYLLVKGQAAFYRDRWIQFLPQKLQRLINVYPSGINFLISTRFAGILLRFIEFLTPAEKKIIRQLKEYNPQAVLVAYRNMPSSSLDLDYLKAAKSLKIPTVIPVFGWDTLTTKGLIQIHPDRLLVWNRDQFDEAREYHNISRDRIRIIGAYQFDDWLSYKSPSCSREEFCSRNGLRASDPILLYLGFSYGNRDTRLKNGHGPVVVEAIRNALDNSMDPKLKGVQIIIRPHPAHTDAFVNVNIRDTIVLPKENTLMNTAGDLQLFYDTLFHSFCAAAINTTAIIDTSIQMKPGIIMFWKDYQNVQGSTHFLRFLETGAVEITRGPEEFAMVVSNLLAGKDGAMVKREEFLKNFIRPRGVEKAASEEAADEIEYLINGKQK